MTRNDSELSRAILEGTPGAEEELLLRFQQKVSWMVRRALSGGADCEDLTSEILQATLTTLRDGRFRGECALGTFVHAIARNKIAEYLRRRRPETTELTESIPDPAPSPEDEAARAEATAAVREALRSLNPKHRRVLYLFYFRGMTVGEIASALGVPGRRVSEWKDYGLKVIRARSGRALERFR